MKKFTSSVSNGFKKYNPFKIPLFVLFILMLILNCMPM